MKLTDKVRGSFPAEVGEAEADAYIEDCRRLILVADPMMADLNETEMVQAIISLAVRRVLQWAKRHEVEGANPDMVSSQAIVGVLTGLGIGLALFNYDVEDIISRGRGVLRQANKDARAEARSRKGPWH